MHYRLVDLLREVTRLRMPLGHATIMLATLAVGIGANIAIFTVVDAVLWRPLPYPDAAGLLRVTEQYPGEPAGLVVTAAAIDAWREDSDALEALGAYRQRSYTVTGRGDPEYLAAVEVSADLLALLRTRPLLGRLFDREDESGAAQNAAIVSHRYWRDRMASEREVVGSILTLDESDHVVVGVMPEGFYFPDRRADIWTPLRSGVTNDDDDLVAVVTRLNSNVTAAQAEAEGELVWRRLASRSNDDGFSGVPYGTPALVAYRDAVPRETVTAVVALQVAMLCFLLIACANASGVLLTHGVARRHEWALRAVLGATRTRLVLSSLAEAVVLGLAAGGLGLVAAAATRASLLRVASRHVDPIGDVDINLGIVAYTFALSVAAGLVTAAVPAWRSSRTDLDSLLRPGAGDMVGGNRRLRFGPHDVLVSAQSCVAVALLVGAGLLASTVQCFNRTDLGFDPAGVLTFSVALPRDRYSNGEVSAAFFDELLDRAAQVIGVEAAGVVSSLPLAAGGSSLQMTNDGRTVISARLQVTSSEYSDAVRMRLVDGRWFTREDEASGRNVLVINATLARQLFGERPAVGRPVSLGDEPMEVVGVVRDVSDDGFLGSSRAAFYLPYRVSASLPGMLVEQLLPMSAVAVRTTGDPLSALPFMRDIVRDMDPTLPMLDVSTMENRVTRSTDGARTLAAASTAIASLSVLLAAAGVYGMVEYNASRRRREISIRLALGASTRSVFGLMLRKGMAPSLAGAAAGVVAALLGARVLASQVYGISMFALGPYVFAVAALLATAFAASWLPARHAARANPATLLRLE